MGFDQHGKTLVPMSFLMIVGNVYVWSQIVSLWIVAPVAIVLVALSLDPIGGVFISVFIQAILLGIGMGILDDSDSGEVDAVSSAAFCGSSEVGVTRTLERAQSDSGFPREFTTLIIPTSKIKANVSITLVRPGSYGRPYG